MSRVAAGFALAGAWLVLNLAPAVRAEDKGDTQAKEIVTQFAKAVKAENLDETMKLVEVPWFHDDVSKILRDRDDLKKELQKAFDERDFSKMTFEIKKVENYQQLREKIASEDDRKIMDEIFGKDGRVVTLDVDLE